MSGAPCTVRVIAMPVLMAVIGAFVSALIHAPIKSRPAMSEALSGSVAGSASSAADSATNGPATAGRPSKAPRPPAYSSFLAAWNITRFTSSTESLPSTPSSCRMPS